MLLDHYRQARAEYLKTARRWPRWSLGRERARFALLTIRRGFYRTRRAA